MTPKTWDFPSRSSDAIYKTSLNADGILTCSCPAWRNKKDGKPRCCKPHMEKLIADNGWYWEPVGDLVRVHLSPTERAVIVAVQPEQPAEIGKAAQRFPMMASAITGPLKLKMRNNPPAVPEFDKMYAGWLADEKIDGHRRMVDVRDGKVTSWAYPRNGDPPHIAFLPDNIVACFERMPEGWYDGEYAAVGEGVTSGDAARLDTEKVFYVFDVLEVLGDDVTQRTLTERKAMVKLACQHAKCPSVQPVPEHPPTWASFLAVQQAGGEGLILKQPHSPYLPNSRSGAWVKVKGCEHHVVTIDGFEQGSYGPCSVILAHFDDGVAVRMKTKNNEWLRMFEKDPPSYVGRKVTMECQFRFNSDGSARHPMAKNLVLDHMTGGSE